MKKLNILPISVILTLLVTAMMATGAAAQTTTDLNYQWSAPVTGSPVDHYIVEHSVDGGTWTQVGTTTTASYTLTAAYGQAHRIRVAGVDADDRQGPYSDPSDPYTPDAGAPGQPGKPILF